MESIKLTVVNEILNDLSNITKLGEVVEQVTRDSAEYDYEKTYFVVKLDAARFGEDMYVKCDDYTDSYGNNYEITGVQFVKPTKVVVTDFESL